MVGAREVVMRVADAWDSFQDFARSRSVDRDAALPSELIDVILDWYASERVVDTNIQDHGDMLLFQWGTCDWGDGPTFQFDLTRQLIDENDPDDDGAIWQLSVTAHYPEAVGAIVGSGNRWCDSPDDLDEFRFFIEASPAMQVVRQRPASSGGGHLRAGWLKVGIGPAFTIFDPGSVRRRAPRPLPHRAR